MINQIVKFISLIGLLASVACAPPLMRVSRTSVTTERKLERTYTIGVKTTTVVGNAVIRIKEYDVIKTTGRAFVPSQPCKITGGGDFVHFFVSPDDPMPILGTVSYAGYQLTEIDNGTFHLWITSDGNLHPKVVNTGGRGDRVVMLYDFKTDPADVKFKQHEAVVIGKVPGAMYRNYELVYTGHNEAGLTFTYREYTPDDYARPAFSQQLSYPVNTQCIKFKTMVIIVHSVSADGITYTVTAE